MNLKTNNSKLETLGYDTIYLEQPVPDIAKTINWKRILSPPPSNLSNVTLKELRLVSRSTLRRTPQEKDLVLHIDKDIDTQFKNLCLSYKLTYPTSYITEFYSIARPLLLNTKAYWNRARPNQLAPYFDLKIDVLITDTHHTASYPSGHTVYASLTALILKDMYPRIDTFKLDSLVKQTARARVLQGVHYPSDNYASIIFSNYVFQNLKKYFRK